MSEVVDEQFYCSTYEDVAESNMTAETHYLQYGWLEGRFPSTLFKWQWEHSAEVIQDFCSGTSFYKIVLVIDNLQDESLIGSLASIRRLGVSVLVLTNGLGAGALAAGKDLRIASLKAFLRLQIVGNLPTSDVWGELVCLNLLDCCHIELSGLGVQSVSYLESWEPQIDLSFHLLEQLFPSLKRVSVVVPNFNYGRYLKERLQSIFGQTYPVYELIVLDDASSDNSILVVNDVMCSYYGKWHLQINDENSGSIFRQWEKGVNLTCGEFIWIAEADDAADERFLEGLLTGGCDFSIAACNAKRMDAHGDIQHNSSEFRFRSIMKQLMELGGSHAGRFFVESCLGVENQLLNVSGLLFNAEALKAELSRSLNLLLEFKVAGDWCLYILMLLRPEAIIKLDNRPLNSHRVHKNSASAAEQSQLQIDEIIRIQQLVLNSFVTDSLEAEQRDYLTEVYQYFNLQLPDLFN